MDTLDAKSRDLENAQFELLKEELQYDQKCLGVHLQKIQNHTVRVAHLKDEWLKKRFDRARQGVNAWWDKNVSEFVWPDKFNAGTGLSMMKDLETSGEKWQAALGCRQIASLLNGKCFWNPGSSELCILRYLPVPDALNVT